MVIENDWLSTACILRYMVDQKVVNQVRRLTVNPLRHINDENRIMTGNNTTINMSTHVDKWTAYKYM